MIGKTVSGEKMPPSLLSRMIKKGMSNKASTYKVVCASFNHRNELLGITSNSFRRDAVTPARYSGYHCEMKALHRWGTSIKSMVIMRLGHSGKILPIDCCEKCEAVLKKCGIKVLKIS